MATAGKHPRTTSKQKIRTVLVTGFDPFGKNVRNPSQQIVEALEEAPFPTGRFNLQIAVLSTCCQEWKRLKRYLDKFKPEVLVLSGLANGRKRISLERFALNIRDYRIKDNRGHQFVGLPIEKSGPEAYQSRVALVRLNQDLNSAGYPCEVSNYAGSFICNELYYRSLHYSQLKGYPKLVLFVHVPSAQAYARTLRKKSRKRIRAGALEMMTEAVALITKSLMGQAARMKKR